MALWMPSPLISAAPLISVLCLAQVHHCPGLFALCRCTSRLVRLICCHIWQQVVDRVVEQPLTCHPFPSLITSAFRSSEVRHLLLDWDSYGGTDPLGMFQFSWENFRCSGLSSQCSVSAASLSFSFPCLLETWQCHLNSERPTALLCRQLPTDFHNISIVQGVWAAGVGSSGTINGMQWCPSNHPVYVSEKYG